MEVVQWLGAIAALGAVFGLARLLGASRPQALFRRAGLGHLSGDCPRVDYHAE